MEKDTDSMATVQMKPEYAPSEVSYGTSEPPPAYKQRQANSVKIAKIIAFTIILSSFILGSFILASTYLQARVSCDQVEALNSVLEKEMLLEAMQNQQQELPKPELLQAKESSYNDLQDLSKDEMNKPNRKDTMNPDDVETIDSHENEESDKEQDDSEESNDLNRIRVKLPLDLDLSDLAHAVLMNNKKSRMNCVVERRRAEELIDAPAKTMQLPFGLNLTSDPKKQKVTGERVAIFCESGEPKVEESQPQIASFRRIIVPFGMPPRFPQMNFSPQMPPQMNFNPQMRMQQQQPPQPQMQNPFTQMNMQMPPQMNMNMPPQMQMPPQQLAQHMQPPQPQPQQFIPFGRPQEIETPQPQVMQVQRQEVPQFRLLRPMPITQSEQSQPRFEIPQQPHQTQEAPSVPQPEVRIHLRRIQLPGPISDIFPLLNNIQNDIQKEIQEHQQREQEPQMTPPQPQNVHVQQVPLAVALQKVGITADDLRNIQRMAEERFHQEIRDLVSDDNSDSDSESAQSGEDENSAQQTLQTSEPITETADQKEMQESEQNDQNSSQEQEQPQESQILPLGRSEYGRSLVLNPIRIPVPMTDDAEIQEAERAHFVHPRSVN